MSGELPEGWSEATLGDVIQLKGEKASPSDQPEAPYLGLEDIEPHTSRIIHYGRAGDFKSAATRFAAGDVLYSRLRPYLNKVFVASCDGLASAEFLALNPSTAIDKEFLRRRIMTGDFLSFTASLDRGDRPRVDYQQIATFPIEVPPLPEQHRIVEKIEALFARSTRVRDELAHIPRLIERYRQAVLEAAFRGDLTAEWRKRHADIEPAADFAEKLRQAVVPGRRPVSEIYSHPEFVRTDIPNTWVWCDLGELFDLQRGRFSIRPRNDPTCFGGQMPFVQIGDLPRDGGEIGAYKQTLNEKGVSVSKVFQKGTPLIAIVGATIANTGRLGFDACCPDSLIAMVSCDGAADEYIEQYLQHAKQYIRNLSFASGGQPNINIGTLQKLPVPLPPIGEIHEILRMIEGCRSAIESVSRELVGAVRMTDRLDQSILDKAFAGKLVPQDPADEPASALLARIKAARAEAPASRRGRKAKG